MTGLTGNNIISLIPQRHPFIMIDELIAVDEHVSTTRFLIQKENIFVEKERFREPGLIENIAQSAAARAGFVARLDNKPVMVGYIGAIKNLLIYSLPLVNQELLTEIIIENQIFDVTLIKGRIRCNNELVAECEMKIFINQSK